MQQGLLWILASLLTALLQLLSPAAEEPAASPPPVRELTVLMGKDGAMAYSPAALAARQGDTVEITLINKDLVQSHSFVSKALNVKTPQVLPGKRMTVRFTAAKAGRFAFHCDAPGHMDAGEVGVLTVEP